MAETCAINFLTLVSYSTSIVLFGFVETAKHMDYGHTTTKGHMHRCCTEEDNKIWTTCYKILQQIHI